MTDAPIFDKTEVLEEYDSDFDFILNMIGILDRDCELRLPKLHAAVKNEDPETLREEAHAIKSGVGNFFASRAIAAAQKLETLGQDGNIAAATLAIQELETELENLRSALAELCSSK